MSNMIIDIHRASIAPNLPLPKYHNKNGNPSAVINIITYVKFTVNINQIYSTANHVNKIQNIPLNNDNETRRLLISQ